MQDSRSQYALITKTFDKLLGRRRHRLGFIILVYIFSIYGFVKYINEALLYVVPSCFYINIDLTELYNVKLNGIDVLASVLGALFIPPFIQMYGIVRSENILIRETVKAKYHYNFVLYIVSLFMMYAFNLSFIFQVIVCVVISIELYFLYKDYYEINFDKKGPMNAVLTSAFSENNSSYRLFIEARDLFFRVIRQKYPEVEDGQFLKSYNDFTFSSHLNINSLNIQRLNEFLVSLSESVLHSDKKRILVNNNQDPSTDVGTKLYWLIPFSTVGGGLGLHLRLSPEVRVEEVKLELNQLLSKFKNIFSYEENSVNFDFRVSNYFSNFAVHIIDQVRNNRLREYNEEIEYLKDYLSNTKLLVGNNCYIFLSFVRSLNSLLKDENYQILLEGQREDILIIIRRVLALSLNSNDKTFVFRSLSLFIGFVDKSGSKDIEYERDITSMLSYCDLSEESLNGVVDGLTFNILSKGSDKFKNISLVLFKNLVEDVRDQEYRLFSKNIAEFSTGLVETRVILIAAQCVETDRAEKFIFYDLINKSDFFIFLDQAYNDKYGKYEPEEFEELEFDRHGVGKLLSFSPINFFVNFTVDYLIWLNNKFTSFHFNCDFSPSYQLEYLLRNVKERLDENDIEIEDVNCILHKLEQRIEDEIISSDLDVMKLERFVTECYSEYNQTDKFSDVIKPQYSEENRGKTIGYNVTIPREFYTVKYDNTVIGQGQHGKMLANAENEIIFKAMLDHLNMVEITETELFQDVVPNLFHESDLSFFSNVWSWDRRLVDFSSGRLASNNNIRIIYDDNRKKYLSLKDKNVKLLDLRSIDQSYGNIFITYKNTTRFNIKFHKTPIVKTPNTYYYPGENKFYTQFRDIGNDDELLEDILKSSYFKEDDPRTDDERTNELKQKLLLKQFIDPEFVINSDIELDDIVKIYKVRQD